MTSTHYASTIDSFALKYLESCGWKRGESLGKKKNGNHKHINVRKKNDRSGIGADKDVQLNIGNHWWENVYNELLDDDSKAIKLNKKDEGKIYQMKGAKSLMNVSMISFINTDITFVRASGKYGKIEAEDLIVYEEKDEQKEMKEATKDLKKSKKLNNNQFDSSENKDLKKDKKRKRDSKNEKRKKLKQNTSDSEDESSNVMDKYKKSTSDILSKNFFEETNGATLKRYKQIGKENRLKKQDEDLLKLFSS